MRLTGLGNLPAGRISYLDVDPFEPAKCLGIAGRCVGVMFVLHPSAEIMLKFSYIRSPLGGWNGFTTSQMLKTNGRCKRYYAGELSAAI